MMNNKIEIPTHIEFALNHIDLIPTTENDFMEGALGKLYILGSEDRKELGRLIQDLESIPEKEWRSWDQDTKWYYSNLLNKADTLFKECVVIPEVKSSLEKVLRQAVKGKEKQSVIKQIQDFKGIKADNKEKPKKEIER